MNETEISQYLQDLEKQITNGLNDLELKGEIEVELAIVTSKKAEGGFKILVAEGGGRYQKDELSRIKFKVGKKVKGVFMKTGGIHGRIIR